MGRLEFGNKGYMVIYLNENVYTPQSYKDMKLMKINGKNFFAAHRKRKVRFSKK